MTASSVTITMRRNSSTAKLDGTRVVFSTHQCFAFDDGSSDIDCLKSLAQYLHDVPALTFIGSDRFVEYFFRHVPDIRKKLLGCITYDSNNGHGLASVDININQIPSQTKCVFLCETLIFSRNQIRKQLPEKLKVIEPTILAELNPEIVPARGWSPMPRNIYPINIPEISFDSCLDFAIVDAPSRNLSLMPNGLGYLNNALKKTSVSFQILDLDIISYHRFHLHRLYDMAGEIKLPGGIVLPEDPWQAEHYDLWTTTGGGATGITCRNEVLEFFRPLIDETINVISEAQPKVLGLSIQGCNEAAAREIAVGVKARLPNIIIVVGGFSCYNADIGRRAFPECDYMCIGEADLTVGPLLEALARDERPFNQPGILSRFDTVDFKYLPAPMIHDLDKIEFPRYEWCDLNVYRNFNDYQLTPIIASRGCRWSRCNFCAERFYWRIRTPENFVDELEWLVSQGCYLFMFNESDLGGMPERVEEICDEIIRRGLHRKVKLTGQLRVNKNQTRKFFEKLREANFVALRFGIDAFSENTLRLQKKGYTVEMVEQNLRDCWEVGIFTEVNWVIGVPGETDKDVEEGINLILRNSKYIGRLANINPLILVNGSVYWIDPEAHDIVFNEPKETLYAKFPRALPADQWHSINPYIDAQVRKERFERIVLALYEAGFHVGAWANRIIEDVKLSRDKARTGGGDGENTNFGEFEIAGGERRSSSSEPLENEKKLELDAKKKNVEKKSSISKYNHIKTAELTSKNKHANPAAEPPLFRVVGEAPHLVRKTDTHIIVFYNGWYYGVPNALTDVDLSNPENEKIRGIVRFLNEEEVISAIDESSKWANSRGQYDEQRKQRSAGSYMRADSVADASDKLELPPKPKILEFDGSYIAVDQNAFQNLFTSSSAGQICNTWKSNNLSVSRPIISGNSFIRRFANKLPISVVIKARELIRQQAYSVSLSTSPLATKSDAQLLDMLFRSIINLYWRKPAERYLQLLKSYALTDVSHLDDKVNNNDYRIVSVVTKGSQPELMWTIASYNIVKYDGVYYGVPHGATVDWASESLADVKGMIIGSNITDIVSIIDDQKNTILEVETISSNSKSISAETTNYKEPVLLSTMEEEEYNIVAYEGWVYGMPHKLGPIDLTQIDVIEMNGVIRDVSRDAVESEIISRRKEREAA